MKRHVIPVCLLWAMGGLCTVPAYADEVYTIYPVPQEQIAVDGQVSLTPTVNIVCDPTIDQYTKDRAQEVLTAHGITVSFTDAAVSGQTNIYLGVAGSEGVADQKATELGIDRSVLTKAGKFDRHIVSLTSDGANAQLVILGENTDATFYGLASLEQMLDNGTENLPCVTINDYADQQSRGLVEGYYGYPYSVAVKKDIMKFMARYKLNTYLYGAKSDPYHSGYYLDPYPTTITEQQEKNGWLTQDMFKELTSTAHATKVSFIWAIHPGLNTKTDQDVTDVMNKFKLMYDLGVRQFGVFTDDAGGYDNPDNFPLYTQFFTNLQNQIDATWNTPGAAPADTVKPLHYVPHVYNLTWTSQDNRQAYFKALSEIPEKIVFYTTGYGVWTVPNNNDLNTMKNEFGRDVAWWWNYPCNDNGRSDSQIFPSDMYSNFIDMTQVNDNSRMPTSLEHCAGVLSNPMQQGEISKIALFSVADYAWNNDGFDNMKSWEAAIPAIISENYAPAFRTLAPYLRDNDPSGLTTLIQRYKTSIERGQEADAASLKAKMDEIIAACETVAGMETSEVESDRLFFNDLRPWLNLVHDMATTVNDFLEAKDVDNLTDKWTAYLAAQKKANAFATDSRYTVETLESMGTNPKVGRYQVNASAVTLKPFVTEWMGSKAFNDMFPERQSIDAPTAYTTADGITPPRVQSNQAGVCMATSTTYTLAPGDLLAIQLVAPVQIYNLVVADTVYNHFDVVHSQNGKTWNTLAKGAVLDTPCKYIGLRNKTNEPQSLRPNRATFRFEIPQPATVSGATIPSGEVWQNHTSNYLYDGDYSTFCVLNRNQINNDAYQITLSKATPVYDVRVCVGTTNGDYMNSAFVQTSNDGQRWTTLRIKGTNITNFTMENENVVKYSDEMSYCDFEADGDSIRYVRLLVRNANTSKWLRLYEIEVNKLYNEFGEVPTAMTNTGIGVTEVFDNQPSTYYSSPRTGELTYNLQHPNLVDNVTVFVDASSDYDATVTATRDGETWIELGELTGAVTSFSLADAHCTDAIAVKLRWTGASPIVHEICEEASTVPVGIDKPTAVTGSAEGIELTNNGGRLTVKSNDAIKSVAIYGIDGRVLANVNAHGKSLITLPRVASQIALVNVKTNSGQSASYKVSIN